MNKIDPEFSIWKDTQMIALHTYRFKFLLTLQDLDSKSYQCANETSMIPIEGFQTTIKRFSLHHISPKLCVECGPPNQY